MNYLELMNSIKEQYDKKWLTPSQLKIFEQASTKFRVQKLVNIYGDRGVGKTFLGWVLATTLNGNYTTEPDKIEPNKVNVIDNYSNKRRDVRMLLPLLRAKSVPKLFVVTNKEVLDDITSIELIFNKEDKIKFKNNLWKCCDLQFPREKDNMHSLIKANISQY